MKQGTRSPLCEDFVFARRRVLDSSAHIEGNGVSPATIDREATVRFTIPAVLLLVIARPVQAQTGCRLVGVWELVSGKADGQPYPTTLHQLKFITRNRWVWIAKDDSSAKELRTTADSLQMFRTTGAGSGTYTVQGTTYTEKIEFFSDPAYIGQSIPFSCRTEGDRFYQTGNLPILQGGKKIGDLKLEEVPARRIALLPSMRGHLSTLPDRE